MLACVFSFSLLRFGSRPAPQWRLLRNSQVRDRRRFIQPNGVSGSMPTNFMLTKGNSAGAGVHSSTEDQQGPHYAARIGVTWGPCPGARLMGWGSQARLVAGSLPTGPGRAQTEIKADVSPPSSRLTTRRKVHEGPVQMQCGLGSSRGGGPRRPNPWTKTLAIGTWNVTSLGGKEPELMREVERYRLEIVVGLTSTHSLGSGTQLLERGWTLHYSGVAQGEQRRAGVGLLIAPQLSRHVLEFTPVNERVASLHLPGWG
ncbi:hypothetical protein L3Q82_019098 [Scortum barcoo]|uniref:Uncharacterized protein n=1 Tax=Scortum barcoo TaxID=214431 RepID=A0ACB8VFX5_9TELE|nr:hypothetical protein L3Q82_019098 [Scortum barcoo]